jgi:hypothetical protein
MGGLRSRDARRLRGFPGGGKAGRLGVGGECSYLTVAGPDLEERAVKNPWMSLWLSAANSAANTYAGTARGMWAAEISRQQAAFAKEMAKAWGLPGAATKPRAPAKRRRKKVD